MRQKMLLGLLAAILTCLTTYISSPAANSAELIDDRTQYIVPILNGPSQNDLALLQGQITSAGGTVVGTVGDFNRYFPRALIVRTNPATYQTFLSKLAAFETTLGDPLPDYRYT